jgi:hypothetical protein
MTDLATHSEREPRGVTTLDLLLLAAGFAFGLVMHQSSAFGHGRAYILPSGSAQFRSLSGRAEAGWVWAQVVGLAAVVVARRFRYGGPIRAAEWLAVSLAIVLFDSAFPGFRPMDWGAHMDQEVVWMDWSGHGSPVALYFWSADTAHPREYLTGVALRMVPVAMLIGITAWVLRTKIGPGWVAVLAIAVAVLVTLGPIRLAEAMSTEVSSAVSRCPRLVRLLGPGPLAHGGCDPRGGQPDQSRAPMALDRVGGLRLCVRPCLLLGLRRVRRPPRDRSNCASDLPGHVAPLARLVGRGVDPRAGHPWAPVYATCCEAGPGPTYRHGNT